MRIHNPTNYLLAAAVFLAVPAIGVAQGESDDEAIEEIVVTGTGVARTTFETPQSVVQFSEEDYRQMTFNSQADVLTQLPGVSAEGGGGEVATNVFHRALPSGGQFSFNPLLFDGMPSFTTFGLNSSAFDVFYRPDLGIERAEFVAAGSSNLCGPGSVAGIINYISKTGGPDPEGTLQVEAAEEGRFRGDYYFSGPLGGDASNTFYALSGFYRFDEGPLDSGLDTQGFQLRGNLKHDFDDGSGSVTLYGQMIDDRVQFFLPLPLDGNSRERVNGNDGATVYTMNTVDAIGLSYDTPDGRFTTPIGDGVVTNGQSIAAVLDKDIGSDWTLNAKIRYAAYDHQFNLFLDGDNVGPNTPETQAEYLTNRGIDAFAANAVFTYAQSGLALAPSDLVFGNRTLDRWRDATDFSGELSIGRLFSAGNTEHNVTIGGFFSQSRADDINYITTYLGDFRNAPKMVNVTLNDVADDGNGNLVATPGAAYAWTLNGLALSNGMTGNHDRSARRAALYLADQIEAGRWTIDVGGRVERLDGDIKTRNTGSFVMGNDPLVNDSLEIVSYTDGSLTSGDLDTTEWALSVGVLYRLTDSFNIFGNASRGYFFPQIRSVPFDDFGNLASYEGEIITQAEAGIKYQSEIFEGTATFFYTQLEDRRNVDFVNDPNNPGGVIEQTSLQSTEAVGLEASGTLYLGDFWSLFGNITLRDHEFTQAEGSPDLIGKELRRQPTEMANIGARFNYAGFDAAVLGHFHGDNFANDSNTVKLDSYMLWRLDAGYTFELDGGDRIRVSLQVFNLTDEEGLQEGSPRQGTAQAGQPAQFFVGRPILPQRAQVRVTYDF
ncbi:MAG: TonB-dependent receptor [Woeseiaceae bacterium]